MSAGPTKIQLDHSLRRVTIDWDDGRRHHFPWAYLRSQCPSATEKAARQSAQANPLQVLQKIPSSDLVEVRPIGNYAVSFTWSDGHAVGIYTWEYLLKIAQDPAVTEESIA